MIAKKNCNFHKKENPCGIMRNYAGLCNVMWLYFAGSRKLFVVELWRRFIFPVNMFQNKFPKTRKAECASGVLVKKHCPPSHFPEEGPSPPELR